MAKRLPEWVKLGAPVWAKEVLMRESTNDHRTWVGTYGPVSGVIVGVRTLSDGHVERGFFDEEIPDPDVFMPESHFTALLIATDLRRATVRARLEDCVRDEDRCVESKAALLLSAARAQVARLQAQIDKVRQLSEIGYMYKPDEFPKFKHALLTILDGLPDAADPHGKERLS